MADDLTALRTKYLEKFDDYFPNIGISKEYEKEIIVNCLSKGKDAYELGYFNLEDDY
ncbi:hypothetical protein HMPREF9225_1650 [Peptoniphilus duerdenii ATCC BAA-1640]|uniref:Uncharacterized protein n=1 Tax=Peptoniphilus duerdenii ATCC BAA-1640 TaxID=862517 RepID=E0NNB1_9FIRM|nr:hypothetical protein [Peptoniphilus duerdenii]EFM24784.1 hypothetical protein HMPREF9225_1650 [Peptoniphilus duerdenii ATCC BAA-1640]